MFKFLLAYSDEPRPIVRQQSDGSTAYGTFDKMDFLAFDDAGGAVLERRVPVQRGPDRAAGGQPRGAVAGGADEPRKGRVREPCGIPDAALFWTIMENLHYPLATEAKQQVQGRLQEQQQVQMQQLAMQQLQKSDDGRDGEWFAQYVRSIPARKTVDGKLVLVCKNPQCPKYKTIVKEVG